MLDIHNLFSYNIHNMNIKRRNGETIMRSKTDRKICGICEFWTENRELVFDKKGTPKIVISDESGLCENPNSNFTDIIREKSKNANIIQNELKYYNCF